MQIEFGPLAFQGRLECPAVIVAAGATSTTDRPNLLVIRSVGGKRTLPVTSGTHSVKLKKNEAASAT